MVEGNHCVADHANTSYSFIVLLQPAVNGLIRKTVNESSTKYVYVMSAYSKGHIRDVHTSFYVRLVLLYDYPTYQLPIK